MAHVQVPGGRLFYQLKGDGEVLVMIRGLGRISDHWLGFDDALANHFKVIVFDARGLGRSKNVNTSWDLSISDLANDVVAILDKEGIVDCHVFGVSLGGMVALSLATDFPNRIRSISVVNSSIAGQRKLRLTAKGILAIASGAVSSEKLHQNLANVLVSPDFDEDKREGMISAWAEIQEKHGLGLKGTTKQLLAAARYNPSKKLKRLKIPTLVISGSDDVFVHQRHSLKIHELIPGSRLVIIEGGGHEIMTDQGKAVLKELLTFIISL